MLPRKPWKCAKFKQTHSGLVDGTAVGAVWWRAPDVLEQLIDADRQGQLMDLLVEPGINSWQGRDSVQLEIKDAREHAHASLAGA